MQQSKGKGVVIGGVMYPVGAMTPNGFEVVMPRLAGLDVEHLQAVMGTNAQTLKKTFGEAAYQDMHSFCADCIASETEKAEVTVVARKFANGRYSYKCFCSCGEEDKEFIFAETLIDFSWVATPPSSKKSVTKPSARSRRGGCGAFASA